MAVREGPPGYDDMLGDAEQSPHLGPWTEIEVDGVGTVRARYPLPNAIPNLAMAANAKISAAEQQRHLRRFVDNHVDDVRTLLLRMMDGELPANTIELVARAVATWGTARPYLAVVILAVTTAHSWRDVRQFISEKSSADPMALPSMHRVLDFTETMAKQAIVSGGTDRDQVERELAQYQNRLYGPHAYADQPPAAGVAAEDVVPAGFEDPGTIAADNRDAFAKLMGAR